MIVEDGRRRILKKCCVGRSAGEVGMYHNKYGQVWWPKMTADFVWSRKGCNDSLQPLIFAKRA